MSNDEKPDLVIAFHGNGNHRFKDDDIKMTRTTGIAKPISSAQTKRARFDVPSLSVGNTSLLSAIIQNRKGIYNGGDWLFYDYLVTNHIPGFLNFAYIRDIPPLILEQAHRSPFGVKASYERHKEMVGRLDGFVTMTEAMADHINKYYGTKKPYRLFQNYPSWRETPDRKRDEFVYIGALPPAIREFNAFLQDVAKCTGKRAYFVKYSKNLCTEKGVSVMDIANYDYCSTYGLLINVDDFNQADEALNRKLLLYLMCGIKPVIHISFIESIRFCLDRGISPFIYEDANDLQSISEHDWGTWNRKDFCMENRIGELITRLNELRGRYGATTTPKLAKR